jgi:hypothetical protein
MSYSPEVLSGEQALDPSRGFRVVVVYPYGSNIGIEGDELKPSLSVPSTIAIESAVEIHRSQPSSVIAIPGETPFGRPNTGDLMVEHVLETSDVSKDSMVVLPNLKKRYLGKLTSGPGRALDNTYLQSRGVYEYFGGDTEDMIVDRLGYHAPRPEESLDAFGMRPDFVAAEAVLHARGITKYDKALRVIAGLNGGWKDQLAHLSTKPRLPLFQRGFVPNTYMRLTGPRLVDVKVSEDGELELEDTWARKKHTQLARELGDRQIGKMMDEANPA